MSDFSRMLPNNQTVLDRDQKWNKLFQKYENCHDCEEDGYDIRDLIACAEVEDEELEEIWNDEEEAIESSEESMDSKENNQELVLYNSKPKNLQDLEKVYEPEFIQGLKKAFNKRCLELDGLNLTFWKRSKTHETFNESNIKTPNFESTSRSYFRSTEQICQSAKKSQKNSSPEPFKAPHPVNLNHNNFQFGNLSQNLDHTSNFETSQRFPFQINDLMNGSQKINIRIREMNYDLSVDGRDITELFLPICNSTFKNVIPSLGNITMNSTIQNQNFHKMKPIRPAINYDVDQIRTEIPQKVMERTESNISNEEPLNNSGIDKFKGINLSNISSDGYNSKESKMSKRNARNYVITRKKKSGKKHRKSKRKETKINVKDLPHIETLMPVSEKLELSYSDVVRLSTKNDLKVSKSWKPVNDSKKQVDQQRAEKSVQVKKEKKYEEILKSYRNIIDSDTSTEDIVEQTNVTKKSKKVDQSKQQQEEKKLPKEKQKVDISTMQKDQKLKDLNKLEIQKPKVAIPSKESTNNQKNHKAKANEKLKEKPEVSNKSKEPEKIQKSSKENKSKIETSKSKISTNDQVKIVKQEKLKVQQKSKKTIESTKKQLLSSKTVFKGHEKENEPELQYDENGVPFRNIGGFIVRYEANDSDNESSLEDDTEFFRRIHAEIRQKKALNAQKF